MKRLPICALTLLLTGLPALAGEKAEKSGAYYCEKDTMECMQEMVAQIRDRGWVGIELDDPGGGPARIKKVIDESPAEAAGLRAGDVLVALDGVRYREENREALKEIHHSFVPGKEVTFSVERDGREIDLPVELAPVPEHVLAQWLGQHLLHHLAQEEGEGTQGESP